MFFWSPLSTFAQGEWDVEQDVWDFSSLSFARGVGETSWYANYKRVGPGSVPERVAAKAAEKKVRREANMLVLLSTTGAVVTSGVLLFFLLSLFFLEEAARTATETWARRVEPRVLCF